MSDEIAAAMQPGVLWRVLRPNGSLWMETSNVTEAQTEALKTGWQLERQWVAMFREWRPEAPKENG